MRACHCLFALACATIAAGLLGCSGGGGNGGAPDASDPPIDCTTCVGTATCTPGESTTCACPAGFDGDGTIAGTGCTDLDECAAGTDTCVDDLDGGSCTNTVGSFTCGCDEDSTGDGIRPDQSGTGCSEKPTNPRLIVPRRMVNDKTLTVRADILDGAGKVDIAGCFDTLGAVTMTRVSDDAPIPIAITVFDDHLPTPPGSMRFYHGIGSVSFTLAGGAAVPAGVYRIAVTVGGLRATRLVRVLDNPTWRVMPARLSGADLVWGPHENIRISAHDTQVPGGQVLTIKPGTMIMVDTTGSLADGTLLTINGRLDASATRARPIHFFSERGPLAMTHTQSGSPSNAESWRGIFLFGSGSSTMKFVVLTGAGNGAIIRHPRPPIISGFGTHNLLVEDGVFVDSTGMMFSSPGTGTYTIRRSLVSRVGIGAEFLSTANTVRLEDDWWTGIGHGPSEPERFDGDGVHVDGTSSNQIIRGNIIADIGDDCIDQSNSTFTLENSIIHGCTDKGVSLTNGSITVRNSLIYDAAAGIRGTARVFNSTISAPGPITTVESLQESVIWPDSVPTCTGTVDYSIVGTASDLGCGMGNRSVAPRFVDPAHCDYTPGPGSPALTGGPMNGRIGWLGFPSW